MVDAIKLPETAIEKSARAITEWRERAHRVPLGTYSGYDWVRPIRAKFKPLKPFLHVPAR